MTNLRESVFTELTGKIRNAFPEGRIEIKDDANGADKITVKDLSHTPQALWNLLVGALDGLSGVAPSMAFQPEVVNETALNVSGMLSNYAETKPALAVVTVTYITQEKIGDLFVSINWLRRS